MKRTAAVALALFSVGLVTWTVALGWAAGQTKDPRRLLVAGFDWRTPEEVAHAVVNDAGGLVVAATWLPSTWLVAAADAEFAERLRAAGAWWTVPAADPLRLAATGVRAGTWEPPVGGD